MSTKHTWIGREISAYRDHVEMARREVNAGNERMRPFLEAYFDRLLTLKIQQETEKGVRKDG